MLSRRLLRVKVMQSVYAYYQNDNLTIDAMEKTLYNSISKSYELYNLVLLLFLELQIVAQKRIDIGKNKKIPTEEELNPNMKFVNNLVINQLADNEQLLSFIEKTGLSWSQNPEIIQEIYNFIIKSELYISYMADESQSYETDKKFVVKLVEKVIGQYVPLYSAFEELSIFWNDESEFIISMVGKTLKEFKQENDSKHPLLSDLDFNDKSNDSDSEFVKTLFRKTLLNKVKYTDLIKKSSHNWDLERVALVDNVLMHIALTEIIEFPLIPLKVTLNEYIEIAKYYSTPKSGTFINGILDQISSSLIKEGKITKYEQ